jgi:ribonuclease D
VDRLREALLWRDEIARAQDRALFRVVQDAVLLDLARTPPGSVPELENRQGLNGALARRSGPELLERFRRVEGTPDPELRGYPRPPRTRNGHRGRPGPEVDERMARLKALRNARALELGMEKGTLLPNSVLQLIAEAPPNAAGDVERVPGVRRWQAALLAEDVMKAL